MANRRSTSSLHRLTFGGRVPWAVGVLLTITLIASLSVAFGSRHVFPLLELGALVPERVLRGEAWRLLTWSVIEPSPLSLIFACLFFYWFGRDLADAWGSRRFLNVYIGIALVAAVGTCLISLVDRSVGPQLFVGSWPLAEAVTVAWGLTFPDRVVRIYFFIPIKGYVLAWLTVALTVVYAIYSGWDHFLPNLLAEGAMLGWIYRRPLVSRWSSWRRTQQVAAQKARTRAKQEQRMATVHVLRKIEEKDDDLAPLSPEEESKLLRLFGQDKPLKRDGEDKPN